MYKVRVTSRINVYKMHHMGIVDIIKRVFLKILIAKHKFHEKEPQRVFSGCLLKFNPHLTADPTSDL